VPRALIGPGPVCSMVGDVDVCGPIGWCCGCGSGTKFPVEYMAKGMALCAPIDPNLGGAGMELPWGPAIVFVGNSLGPAISPKKSFPSSKFSGAP